MSSENTVVTGEASESDEDVVEEAPKPAPAKAERPSSVVVLGEASESDDEDQDGASITPLRVESSPQHDSGPAVLTPEDEEKNRKPKYDTLLHWKLKERNVELRKNLCTTMSHVYSSNAKDVHNITVQLSKSHQAIQEVSHNMRMLTNDLFHLEDKLDIIRECELLPTINISVSGDEPAAAVTTPAATVAPAVAARVAT